MIHRALALALALIAGAARPGRADDSVAKADKLFDEGRALMATDLHAACQKFDESLKFNSQAIGTLLNVALCDEKLGRTASALAKFTEARDRAREAGMAAHLQAAEARIAVLTPKVPYVTLRFATPPAPDTRIVIDDQVIALTALDKIAIDPGTHPLVVSAPGHLAFQATISIADGETRVVAIPALEAAVSEQRSRRRIGAITAISGAGALGTGIVIGLVARARYKDQFEPDATGIAPCLTLPTGHIQCRTGAYGATKSARTLGTVGTVVGGVGVAAIAVGAYLWVRSPRAGREARISLVPQLDPGGAAVVAVGRF
jgi:hypothetical protein